MILKAKKQQRKLIKQSLFFEKIMQLINQTGKYLKKKMRRHKLPSFFFYMENGKKFKVLRKGNK